MAMTTMSAAGGDIEVMFLEQIGDDPFTTTPERQRADRGGREAGSPHSSGTAADASISRSTISGSSDEAAAIVEAALRESARSNNVSIRIIYDATTEPNGDAGHTAVARSRLEADKKAPGHRHFRRTLLPISRRPSRHRLSRADAQQISDPLTALRITAAVFLGSANYTNDFWGLQENNLLQLRSRPLASLFSENFSALFASGRIANGPPAAMPTPSALAA